MIFLLLWDIRLKYFQSKWCYNLISLVSNYSDNFVKVSLVNLFNIFVILDRAWWIPSNNPEMIKSLLADRQKNNLYNYFQTKYKSYYNQTIESIKLIDFFKHIYLNQSNIEFDYKNV